MEMTHPGSLTDANKIERAIRAMGGIWEPMDDGGKFPNILTTAPKGDKIAAVLKATMGMVKAAVKESAQVRATVRRKHEQLELARSAFSKLKADSKSVGDEEKIRRQRIRTEQMEELRLSHRGARDSSDLDEEEDLWRWERAVLAGRYSASRIAGGEARLREIREWFSKGRGEDRRETKTNSGDKGREKKEEGIRAKRERREQDSGKEEAKGTTREGS